MLGDKSIMLDYFRVLKFLKYQDAMYVALKMHEKFDNDFYSIPLAICFEKGIGCLSASSEKKLYAKNTQEALKIYKQLLMVTYSDDLREQAAYLLYRIAKILKKFNFESNSKLF